MRDLGSQEQSVSAAGATVGTAVEAAPGLPSVEEVRAFAARVAAGHGAGFSDAERVEFLTAGEELKAVIEGAQALVTLELDASQRRVQARQGVRGERQGRGVAAQVGLARRSSHHRGQRWLGLAKRLGDMPETFAALRAGRITEFKAHLIVRGAEALSAEHRGRVDLAIAGDPDWLEGLGERELEGEVTKIGYRLDQQTFVKRTARAVTDRRVTSRPAPDTMVYLTALLPVVQGVGAYAGLHRWAVAAQTGGDPRSHGQLMADRLVELITGAASAQAQPVAVEVMINDTTILGLDDEPALVAGYGPIPAAVAMALVLTATEEDLATLRRLYTHPGTGRLVGMESRAEKFPPGLAGLIRRRDQRCRTRWCDAPIRDSDHVKARLEAGPTTVVNGQGLCEACNIAKEAPGWTARPVSRPGPGPAGPQHHPHTGPTLHTVETTTPTGHVYVSSAPQVGIVRPVDRSDGAAQP